MRWVLININFLLDEIEGGVSHEMIDGFVELNASRSQQTGVYLRAIISKAVLM